MNRTGLSAATLFHQVAKAVGRFPVVNIGWRLDFAQRELLLGALGKFIVGAKVRGTKPANRLVDSPAQHKRPANETIR